MKNPLLALICVLIIVAIALLCGGCAVVKQTLVTTDTQTNGVVTTRESKATAYTLFDGRAAVNGLKTANSAKTQSIGLESSENASAATNAAGTLDALARLLGALPK